MRLHGWIHCVLWIAAAAVDAAEPSSLSPSPQLLPDWKLQLMDDSPESPADAPTQTNRFRAEHVTDTGRTRIESAVTDGDSTDEFRFNARQEWLFPDHPWLIFAQGDYEVDRSETWRHRAGPYAGVGVNLRQLGPDLTLRLGAGFLQDVVSEQEPVRAQTRVGSEMTWQFTQRQKLSAAAMLYPDVDETGAYRVSTSADWSLTVDRAEAILLTVGVRNEYESPGLDAIADHDLKVFAGLTLKF